MDLDVVKAVLTAGGFEYEKTVSGEDIWQREFEPVLVEADDIVNAEDPESDLWRRHKVDRFVKVFIHGADVNARISPVINTHSLLEHRVNALGASVVFSILAVLGERMGGVVTQESLRGECARLGATLTIANYPEERLKYEAVCPGFQAAFHRGIHQVWTPADPE